MFAPPITTSSSKVESLMNCPPMPPPMRSGMTSLRYARPPKRYVYMNVEVIIGEGFGSTRRSAADLPQMYDDTAVCPSAALS